MLSLGWAIDGASRSKPRRQLSDDELIERYIEHLRWRGLEETTIEAYVKPVGMLSRSSFSGLGGVTDEELASVVKEHRHTPEQRHRYALHLDRFYVWARDARLLSRNPAEPIARP
jgi:site-specific recombinase XerD